ncbi:MAG TPA: RIP metalloprotease RseP [Terracidiphilus sp.]|nr:RIP metalloprotease RseP [Terracidiphilus sp.]
MHDFLVSAAAFIVLIGIMVVVHEFGHFVVAKLCGVRVEAFSVGFGPRLFGIKRGDTDYKVCLLPLGGFVKMTGENPGEEQSTDDPGAFTSHPRWQRMLIGVAGPVANFILAFAAMAFYFGWINEVPARDVKTTSIDWVVPGSAAAEAGLKPGDLITRFASQNNPTWDQVFAEMSLDPNQTVPVTVERGGSTVETQMHVPLTLGNDDLAGMLPQYIPGPITVQSVMPGSPAAEAGLRPGDALVSIDGHEFHSVGSLLDFMQEGAGKPISLMVERGGKTIGPIIAKPAKLDAGWKLGFMAVPIPIRRSPLPLKAALVKSGQFCADGSTLIVQMLERIATHQVSAKQLTGPVGIAQIAGEAAQTKGWYSKFYLAGEISLNLGILNLMPFPILDGGLIFLLLIESILRHDISTLVKERIYQAAFVVLVMFFVFVIFNDVTKLPIFTHVKP